MDYKSAAVCKRVMSIVDIDIVEAVAAVTVFVENYIVECFILWGILDEFFDISIIEVVDISASAGESVIWVIDIILLGRTG